MAEHEVSPELNLLDAASAPTILEAALRYQAFGLTVLPILKGEKVSGLKGWQDLAPTPADLRRFFGTGKYGGVALRPGARSQNLVMIDCDGERVYEAFCAQFPALVETYTERSGSGKGYHLFYQAEHLPQNSGRKVTRKGILDTDDLGFEVFFDTGAVVVAPSIHPSGNPYTVEKPLDVRRVDHLDDVTAWAYTLETKQERESRARKAAAPTTPTKAHTGTAAPRNGQIAPDLIIDIEQALGIKGYKGDGWSKPIRCVLAHHEHDDSNPAASWNRDKQIYSCLKCGVTDMLAHQVAEVLGLDVSSYYEQPPTIPISRKQTTAVQTDKNARTFAEGVPDSWRSALLDLIDVGALVYELITEAAHKELIDAAQFDYAALMRANLALGWGINESTLRRGMKALKGGLFSDLHTERDKETVCKIENNLLGGRTADLYSLHPIDQQRRAILELAAPGLYERAHPAQNGDNRPAVVANISARQLEALGVDGDEARQIADELNTLSQPAYQAHAEQRRKASKRARVLYARLEAALNNPTHTPLPDGWTPRDVPSYRDAFLRGLHSAGRADVNSHSEIARALGISTRSVGVYVERAGLIAEPHFEQQAITSAQNVEREITRLAYEVKGRPMQIIACAADGASVEMPYSSETARDFVPAQLAAGAQVSVRFQVANRHTVDPNATPAAPAPRRPAAKPRIEQDTADAAREAAATPAEEPHAPGGYHPQWVRDQLALRLRVMGWIHEGKFTNPETGERASIDAGAIELIELMLGRKLNARMSSDSLIEFAVSLGAVVTVLA